MVKGPGAAAQRDYGFKSEGDELKAGKRKLFFSFFHSMLN